MFNFPIALQIASVAFVSMFGLYFLDKYRKQDLAAFTLAMGVASLFAYLMLQRIELTILITTLIIAMILTKKIDTLVFIFGAIATFILYLYYGGFDGGKINDLISALTVCNNLSCKRPLLGLFLLLIFIIDELLHESAHKMFRNRVLFPISTFVLFALGIIDFYVFVYFLAFDLGYSIFKFTSVG